MALVFFRQIVIQPVRKTLKSSSWMERYWICSRFQKLRNCKSSPSYEDENLDHFLQKISQMMAEQKWEKSEIVDLFHQMIPDFNHKETGKYLDVRNVMDCGVSMFSRLKALIDI